MSDNRGPGSSVTSASSAGNSSTIPPGTCDNSDDCGVSSSSEESSTEGGGTSSEIVSSTVLSQETITIQSTTTIESTATSTTMLISLPGSSSTVVVTTTETSISTVITASTLTLTSLNATLTATRTTTPLTLSSGLTLTTSLPITPNTETIEPISANPASEATDRSDEVPTSTTSRSSPYSSEGLSTSTARSMTSQYSWGYENGRATPSDLPLPRGSFQNTAPTPMIIGSVGGSLALIAFGVLLGLCILRRRRRHRQGLPVQPYPFATDSSLSETLRSERSWFTTDSDRTYETLPSYHRQSQDPPPLYAHATFRVRALPIPPILRRPST